MQSHLHFSVLRAPCENHEPEFSSQLIFVLVVIQLSRGYKFRATKLCVRLHPRVTRSLVSGARSNMVLQPAGIAPMPRL